MRKTRSKGRRTRTRRRGAGLGNCFGALCKRRGTNKSKNSNYRNEQIRKQQAEIEELKRLHGLLAERLPKVPPSRRSHPKRYENMTIEEQKAFKNREFNTKLKILKLTNGIGPYGHVETTGEKEMRELGESLRAAEAELRSIRE